MEKSEVIAFLNNVFDPEIPVLTINDMGVVREVSLSGDACEVVITPTYTGCPAMDVIAENIVTELKKHGIENVKVSQTLSPPWTTDWISEDGLRKLEEYGIAPPVKGTADKGMLFSKAPGVRCPKCKSMDTQRISNFGSTACKAAYKCNSCLEPFDYFKCL